MFAYGICVQDKAWRILSEYFAYFHPCALDRVGTALQVSIIVVSLHGSTCSELKWQPWFHFVARSEFHASTVSTAQEAAKVLKAALPELRAWVQEGAERMEARPGVGSIPGDVFWGEDGLSMGHCRFFWTAPVFAPNMRFFCGLSMFSGNCSKFLVAEDKETIPPFSTGTHRKDYLSHAGSLGYPGSPGNESLCKVNFGSID